MSKKPVAKKSKTDVHSSKDIIVLTKLQVGKDDFQSDGSAFVKVTRGGVTEILQIPIRSSGVTELIEAMSRKRPQPPDKKTLVKQNSSDGREMGLSKDKWVTLPNLNDAKYQSSIQKWNVDLTFGIVLAALNLPIFDADGELVFDPTDRNLSAEEQDTAIDAMKTLGFTMDHFTQIATDAQKLTEFSEQEKEDFFGESSDSQTENGID